MTATATPPATPPPTPPVSYRIREEHALWFNAESAEENAERQKERQIARMAFLYQTRQFSQCVAAAEALLSDTALRLTTSDRTEITDTRDRARRRLAPPQ